HGVQAAPLASLPGGQCPLCRGGRRGMRRGQCRRVDPGLSLGALPSLAPSASPCPGAHALLAHPLATLGGLPRLSPAARPPRPPPRTRLPSIYLVPTP